MLAQVSCSISESGSGRTCS